MKRREFIQTVPLTALVPTALAGHAGGALAAEPAAADAAVGGDAAASGGRASPAAVPDFAKDILTTDMNGLGPDGKPNGQKATFSGASMAGATASGAGSKMQLTADEQAILDGAEGPEKAKLMKILVRFGETFGATKMVDLGGAPHSNLYIGAPYLESLIVMLEECAAAGLKASLCTDIG